MFVEVDSNSILVYHLDSPLRELFAFGFVPDGEVIPVFLPWHYRYHETVEYR